MKYFYEEYTRYFRRSITEDFHNAIQLFDPEEVVFTGHSLGGAMVQLAAIDLLLKGMVGPHRKVKIYTFGQPRFGKTYSDRILKINI